MLIARSRVLREHVQQGLTAFLRQLFEQACRTFHAHGIGRERKAAERLRMRVRVRKIRLDVENRRAVHQVRARDMQHRAVRRVGLHAVKPHRGQSDLVRAERRACRKHADALVAAQFGRAHSRGPALTHRGGKLPDQPQVRETLYAAQRIRVAVFRLEYNARRYVRQSTLPRNAEFGGEIAAYPRNNVHFYRL